MNTNRYELHECICEDVEGSPFNGMKGMVSKHEINVLNTDAVERGLTRRWYILEEYQKKGFNNEG